MDAKKLLDVQGLKVYFDNDEDVVKAVDGISFSVSKGKVLGIVGESGSGKSVTALAVMRLLKRMKLQTYSGVVNWKGGKDLMRQEDQDMEKIRGKEIAMVFQNPMSSLNPVLKCGRQILEAILKHRPTIRQPRQEVRHWLESVKLGEVDRIYNAYPHELSGGQLQRIMIAMAMSGQPELLIADEPTTALDVTVQRSILELIKELIATREAGVIFISHDIGVIAEMADDIAVMFRGQIVEMGPASGVLEHPQHPYTKGLLHCRPPLKKRYYRLPVLNDFMEIETDQHGNYEILEKNPGDLTVKYELSSEQTDIRLKALAQQPPFLVVKNLRTWFPVKRPLFGRRKEKFVKAVDGVSFEIFPGETIGLVGESGSGKTTLGRSILGLIPAASGSVRYADRELLALDQSSWKPVRKDLQIILQNPYAALNPRMPIGKAITEPMAVFDRGSRSSERIEAAIDLLETVGLQPDHFYRYPYEFSGGQQQRIAIARALAVKPKFIICDESVSALDVSIQAQILNLLINLRDKFDLTYIFISHDLSVIRFISDRIVVMNKGKIEEMGASDDIFNNPQRKYTQRLIEAIPRG